MEEDNKTRKPSGRRRVLILIILNILIFVFVLGAIELYLRRTQPYIVMDVEKINRDLEKTNETRRFFTAYTMNGRRLIPHARSVVENHPLSHQSVMIRINGQGFRGPEVPTQAKFSILQVVRGR